MRKLLLFFCCRSCAGVICPLGDQLVVSGYTPGRDSQRWRFDKNMLTCRLSRLEDDLLRWQDRMVVGVKTPVAPQEQNLYLHVGPPDTLVGTHWTKEFVYIGTYVLYSAVCSFYSLWCVIGIFSAYQLAALVCWGPNGELLGRI